MSILTQDPHGGRLLLLHIRVPGQLLQAGSHPADGQVLPHPDPGHEGWAGGEPVRAGGDGEDGVGQGAGGTVREVRNLAFFYFTTVIFFWGGGRKRRW